MLQQKENINSDRIWRLQRWLFAFFLKYNPENAHLNVLLNSCCFIHNNVPVRQACSPCAIFAYFSCLLLRSFNAELANFRTILACF
jgi:hypothetical protein